MSAATTISSSTAANVLKIVNNTGSAFTTATNYAVTLSDATVSAANADTIANDTSGIVTATVTATGAVADLNTALAHADANDALTLVLDATTADIAVLNVATGLNGKTSVNVGASSITSVTDTTNVNTIDLTTAGITWGSTISVTGGAGADNITLRAGDAAKETLVFAETATDNGADTIGSFTAGATKDVLNFEAFLTAGSTTVALSVASGSGAAVFNNKVSTIAKANISDTTDGVLATTDFAASGKAFAAVADGDKGVVMVEDSTGGAKIYYVYDSNAASGSVTAAVTLVGTLTSVTSGFHADNFTVA